MTPVPMAEAMSDATPGCKTADRSSAGRSLPATGRPARRAAWSAGELALLRLAGFLVLLWAVALPLEVTTSGPALDVLNGAVPGALFLASLATAYAVVRSNRWNVLTPAPWFLASAAAYCGLGPLVYTFGKDEAIAAANLLFPVEAADLARTNRLNVVGLLMLVAGFLAGARLLRSWGMTVVAAPGGENAVRPTGTRTAAVLLLAVGLPIRYGGALPYEFGQSDVALPASLNALENCVLLGLFLLGYESAATGRRWKVALIGLLAVEITVNFLRFNKTALLLTMVLPLLGRYLAVGRMRILVAGGVAIFGVYMLVSPLVSWGRRMTEPLAAVEPVVNEPGVGFQPRTTLRERWQIVADSLDPETAARMQQHGDPQSWWTRLCYANVQAFVITCHDADLPGDTFAAAPYVLIPRAVWEDKPLITEVAKDFTQLTVGHRQSYTGLGLFGEAYWNGGWPLVGVLSAAVGMLYAGLGGLALTLLGRLGWVFLPCVFLGIMMGFRLDGWFVSTYLGTPPIYLVFLILAFMVARCIPARRVRVAGEGERHGS